jgi:hypothetical protein
MKKNFVSQSAFFNPRIFAAFVLCSVGAWIGMLSFASTPSSGTLTDTSGPQVYTAGPFNVSNQTPVIQLDSGPECHAHGAPGGDQAQPCDDYALTVTLPGGYHSAHPIASVKVTMSWTDAGAGQSDYDLYIYKNPRNDCSPTDCTQTSGSQAADWQSASGANPEVANISPLADGTQKFTIVAVPFTATGEVVTIKAELLSGSGGGGGGGGGGSFGGPDTTTPGVPRYQNFYAPSGSTAALYSGEFNIGFDVITKHIMTMNSGPIWRLTTPENLTPAKPECCEALWEDKSQATLLFGLDPILWTDRRAGRTFASNSTAGANVVYGYTDPGAPFNDGDQWVPLSPSPINGSDDHETIGSGPYPNVAPYNVPPVGGLALNDPNNPVTHGEAVYYCGQTFPVGASFCQRSDDFGASYGPGVPVYNGATSNCGGLHGHLHASSDGTAWLPVPQCGTNQGGAFSTDGGRTWSEFLVPGTKPQPAGADPSIAIDSDNTIYYAYVNNEPVATGNPAEGHARAKVGHLNTTTGVITWGNDFDLGASHGIVNAAEIEAVGGSSGRAAVGFLGTNLPGDYQANNYPGNWYAFITTTYDGGTTWMTVNATPNDPVQHATGIWQQGGSATDRNLLDFNEITIDDTGRVLYGYSDGCVSAGCIGGTEPNDYTAYMRVARQSGGKRLIGPDPTEPAAPKPPCLSGTRDADGSHLTWKAPDNGGADITGYVILRGTSASGESVLIANTGNTKTAYDDITADPNVSHYFYTVKAINGSGTGSASNELDLTVAPPAPLPRLSYSCTGNDVIIDGTGDAHNPAPGGQGPTDQADITGVSFSADATTLTTTMKIANLTTIPSPGNTFTSYYVIWTSSDGVQYGTEVDVGGDPAVTISYFWGHYDAANNRLADFNSVTGTFNMGANGTLTVPVPRNMIGNPTIPISNPNGTPAVRHPFAFTIAGEGALGAGTTWISMMDRAPNSDLGFGQNWAVCGPPPLASVVSRKRHGSLTPPPNGPGDLTLNLDPTTAATIEPRSGGSPTGNHTLVFEFASSLNATTPVASITATATTSTGTQNITATGSLGGLHQNEYTVNLTGVPNASHVNVTLNNAADTVSNVGNVSVRMDVLLGDVNQNGNVDGNDVSAVQSKTRQAVNSSTFKFDVNTTGSIDGNDVSLTQSKTRTSLP